MKHCTYFKTLKDPTQKDKQNKYSSYKTVLKDRVETQESRIAHALQINNNLIT
jgi:hypothetical protein